MKSKKIFYILIMLIFIMCLTIPLTKVKGAASPGQQILEDGVYEIKANIGNDMYLDVWGATNNNGDKLQICNRNNNNNQKFRLTYKDGYYTIVALHSNKALDVYGDYRIPGTKVTQFDNLGQDNQKWVIKAADNGTFNIISKNTGFYLDIHGGSSVSGTNVEIFNGSGNGTSNQKFKFEKVLDNGTYEIETALSSKMCLDVAGASTSSGANIQLWDKGNTSSNNQKFNFTRTSDGYYIIKAAHSGLAMDVFGGYSVNGTNVQQFTVNNQNNQKWIVQAAGNGKCYLLSRGTGLYLDIHGASTAKGTNVEIFQGNGQNNQKYKLNKVNNVDTPKPSPSPETKPSTNPNTGTKTLEDGVYKIKSAVNTKMVLDVDMSNGGQNTSANLQIYEDCNAKNQKFYIKHIGNGYYTIKAIHSKQMLDVYGAYTADGTNVQQFTETQNATNQQWLLKPIQGKNNTFNIISKNSGRYLDIWGENPKNGVNIQIFGKESKPWREFVFEPTDYQVIDDGTYEIQTYKDSSLVVDIYGGSTANSTPAQIWNRGNTEFVENQRFKVTYDSKNKNYTIVGLHSGKALYVEGGKSAKGKAIQIYSKQDNNNAQKWIIEDLQDGTYNIKSQNGEFYIDEKNSSVTKGTTLQLNTKTNGDSQRFKFVTPGNGNYKDLNESKYPNIKNVLDDVQRRHPNWTINIYYTGLDWNSAIDGEFQMSGGSPRSLTQKGNQWRVDATRYDVSLSWFRASKAAIAYMMDPRNSFEDDYIFQFQDISSSSGTKDDIKKMVAGSFIDNDSCIQAILDAAKTSNISPFHIASRIIQESGKDGKSVMNGYSYNGRTVYNLFNISVSGNGSAGIEAGAKYAFNHGWFSKEESIKGGAAFLRNGYLNVGQVTPYFQKYNVVQKNNLYNNQYMQNIHAANSEGMKIYAGYKTAGLVDSHFTLLIPVYENMPTNKAPRPAE